MLSAMAAPPNDARASVGGPTSAARIALVALVAALAGWLGGRSSVRGGGQPAGEAKPIASGSAGASAVASVPPPDRAPSGARPASSVSGSPPDRLALAASGDIDALKELDKRSHTERTVAEALALAAGHAELARREAETLGRDLALDASLWSDRTTIAHAYRLALDPAVAPEMLRIFAETDSPIAADLLFDLATRGEPGGRLTLLADDLLLGPAARREATKALAVALDLRAAAECWQVAALLPRVLTDADDRSRSFLDGFEKEAGCGPKRADDCFACLRTEPARAAFAEARAAAASRAYERPWATQKR